MAGDFLECLPELIFEADARFVTSNDNRPLDDRGFHPSLGQPTVFARLGPRRLRRRDRDADYRY